jgi:phage shock protein C
MFCTQCGIELEPQHRYCNQCGKGTGVGSPWPDKQAPRRLELSKCDKKIAGVCSGFAHYFQIDVTLMRIIWVVGVFVPPSIGLIAYLFAWLIMPKGRDQFVAVPQASTVPHA